jgi:hypothetical protein
VVRGQLDEPQLLAANFEAMKKGDLSQNFMLEDGDMVFVGRRKLSTYFDIMRVFVEPLSILTTTAVLTNAVSK